MNFLFTLLVSCFISLSTMTSQDRIFTYTHQSNVLTPGNIELEIYNTLRFGKERYYSRYDNRIEFEFGVLNKLQTAFYINTSSISKTDINNHDITNNVKFSFSNEWKLKLMDANIKPLGMGLYFEYGISSNEFEIESKLILDKRFNNFYISTNLIYELEIEPEFEGDKLEYEKEHKTEFNLAMAYEIKHGFYLTSENIFKSKYTDWNIADSAIYSGLGFSYLKNKYWLNFTILPKIKTLDNNIINSQNIDNYEKIQTRLLFSIFL